jgi:hypothetical protein
MNDSLTTVLCGRLGKTGGAFRFSLTFSPFFVKKKGMASAAIERESACLILSNVDHEAKVTIS